VRTLPATRGLEVLTWRELAPQIASLLSMSDAMTLVILVLVFITTIAGVANTMLMATFERIHEFGMLLALGLKRARLVRMLLIESLVLGLAGALIGSVLGGLLAWPGISRGIDITALTGAGGTGFALEGLSFTRFYLVPDARGVVVGVLAVMVTSVAAAVLPARRIAKLEPAQALRS
jgi:ABC-type lipoprotein release transport system permease subunit